MADDPKFSKEVENKNPRSLEEFKKDSQSNVSDKFDRAKAAQQQKKEQASPQRQESEQVKKSAPGMQPTPPQNSKAVDSRAHNERMAKDDKAAKQAEARDRAASINKDKDNQLDKGKDKDPER